MTAKRSENNILKGLVFKLRERAEPFRTTWGDGTELVSLLSALRIFEEALEGKTLVRPRKSGGKRRGRPAFAVAAGAVVAIHPPRRGKYSALWGPDADVDGTFTVMEIDEHGLALLNNGKKVPPFDLKKPKKAVVQEIKQAAEIDALAAELAAVPIPGIETI